MRQLRARPVYGSNAQITLHAVKEPYVTLFFSYKVFLHHNRSAPFNLHSEEHQDSSVFALGRVRTKCISHLRSWLYQVQGSAVEY
jgi:hypothetical protein